MGVGVVQGECRVGITLASLAPAAVGGAPPNGGDLRWVREGFAKDVGTFNVGKWG